jgi:DNA-binding transcriptional ArsR family regulator
MDIQETERLINIANLMHILGHPMRIAMVEALHDRTWCVCELAEHLGLNKSAASKHLSLLRSVGVVELEKQGTQVMYSLTMPCVIDMLHCTQKTTSSEKRSCCTSEPSCGDSCS